MNSKDKKDSLNDLVTLHDVFNYLITIVTDPKVLEMLDHQILNKHLRNGSNSLNSLAGILAKGGEDK